MDSRPVVNDPTDDILGAAARLFAEHGVSGTTMSRIATEVGLKQSSLYYYFRNRDEVVLALMDRANVVPLDLVESLVHAPGGVPEKLYCFVKGDVEALCALPFDINEVHRIAARDTTKFATYWRERRRLERKLANLVRQGCVDGTLREVDPRLTALTIMANDEGVQNWFRLGKHRSSQIARFLARLTVAGLLPDGDQLDAVEEAAQVHAVRTAADGDRATPT